ncbi:family 10 glycosylhydrolase [Botrimarina hoheduenensis]|nr:family 10 glycosylhydrolase [Botrimarina hoheduenensis]
MRLALLLCCLGVSVAGLALAAPAEVRGTWLTTTGPNHISSGANTASVMSDLRDIGLNTVYIETWKQGYTNFPSATMQGLIGRDRSPFLGTTRDLVAETIVEAHRNEMNYIGWFEYGFASEFVGTTSTINTFNNPLTRTMATNGWLLRDQSGRYGNSTNGFAWMNPAVPQVRQLLIDITLESIAAYDLDGVQFDDRLAWPREFGWDTTTASLYFQETGRALPSNIDDSNFRNWRQDKVTLFAAELSAAVRAVRPDLHLSVSPSVTSFSDVNYNAEWPLWQNLGIFDEYAVQVYRDNIGSFNATMPAQVAQFSGGDLDQFVVGLRGNGTGANTPYADLEDMIEGSRNAGAAGHAIFYSKAVRDDYRTQLTAFYDVAGEGQADNPFFGPNHRPAPTVATASGFNRWSVDVPADGNYRILVNNGSRWIEVSGGWLPAGPRELTLFGASGVELLVDHREADLPDFNGNGEVDVADYTLWRDTLFSSTDLRADANGDRVVNQLDYDLWNAAFGRSTLSLATTIPEPTAFGLLGCLLVAVGGTARNRTVEQRHR